LLNGAVAQWRPSENFELEETGGWGGSGRCEVLAFTGYP
jgi:hypothetical protein